VASQGWPHRNARLVQALRWLKDMMPDDDSRIGKRIDELLVDPENGAEMRKDLAKGFSMLPIWMQNFLRGFHSERVPERAPVSEIGCGANGTTKVPVKKQYGILWSA
jgi:hypothetical protein